MQAIRHGTMLPSLQRNEIGTSELDPFSQLNTWPVVSPVNASRLPCERFTAALAGRTSCITRGRGGWLDLPHGGLSRPILCQLSWHTPKWVKLRKSHDEQMSSALDPTTDMALLGTPEFRGDEKAPVKGIFPVPVHPLARYGQPSRHAGRREGETVCNIGVDRFRLELKSVNRRSIFRMDERARIARPVMRSSFTRLALPLRRRRAYRDGQIALSRARSPSHRRGKRHPAHRDGCGHVRGRCRARLRQCQDRPNK